MKMRNKCKGKIHPSPSSSSSSPKTYPNQNALSVLALLPVAILALISGLSADDKEVLAYMVTRSLNPSSTSEEEKAKKIPKKVLASRSSSSVIHKVPVFDCECFECYKSYWLRWDSSPDKELIHKAIEEFEEFLFSQEQVKKSEKGKRREKVGRRVRDKAKEEERECRGNEVVVVVEEVAREDEAVEVEEVVEDVAATVVVENYNKGFVRKVLPDVVGLLNSRLWGLWSPNV